VLIFLGEFLKPVESKKNSLLDYGLQKGKLIGHGLSSSLAYVALKMPLLQFGRYHEEFIITPAFFSRIFLKTVFSNTAILLLSGIIEVQLVGHGDQSSNNKIIGIILMAVSLIFNSLELKKWIFKKYDQPLEMVFLGDYMES
jgi:hypothetical protein